MSKKRVNFLVKKNWKIYDRLRFYFNRFSLDKNCGNKKSYQYPLNIGDFSMLESNIIYCEDIAKRVYDTLKVYLDFTYAEIGNVYCLYKENNEYYGTCVIQIDLIYYNNEVTNETDFKEQTV